jgi:hypothetical protein
MSDIFDDIMGDRQRRMRKEQEEFDTLFGHKARDRHARSDEDHPGDDDGHHHDHEHCDGCDHCEDMDEDAIGRARKHERMIRERKKDDFDWPI